MLDADNGDDAILLARTHRPDLALLDIRMHGLSGFDVGDYLREYCPRRSCSCPRSRTRQTVTRSKALGAVAYLVKPLDIGKIIPPVEADARVSVDAGARRRRPRASLEAPAATAATPARRWRSAC